MPGPAGRRQGRVGLPALVVPRGAPVTSAACCRMQAGLDPVSGGFRAQARGQCVKARTDAALADVPGGHRCAPRRTDQATQATEREGLVGALRPAVQQSKLNQGRLGANIHELFCLTYFR